jgi:hypothetical protein
MLQPQTPQELRAELLNDCRTALQFVIDKNRHFHRAHYRLARHALLRWTQLLSPSCLSGEQGRAHRKECASARHPAGHSVVPPAAAGQLCD